MSLTEKMAEQEERFVTLAELTVDILGLPIELLKVFEGNVC